MTTDDTIIMRPVPRRPETGLGAWLATVGYLAAEYNPDALLALRATPSPDHAVVWTASVSWGHEHYSVERSDGQLAEALRGLWLLVEREHQLFKTLEAAARRPAGYPPERWIDGETEETLSQLIRIVRPAFALDWSLIIIYKPIELPALRVQARLIARGSSVQLSGGGSTIRTACHALLRHAAPGIFASVGRYADADLPPTS
jgi:hypothetical protein